MITLPLPKEINRCLGHGEKTREWCDRLAAVLVACFASAAAAQTAAVYLSLIHI